VRALRAHDAWSRGRYGDGQVTYDLTSLSADGDARLADFDRAHDADVAEWETAIAEALASGA
jgi:hypothetical protein